MTEQMERSRISGSPETFLTCVADALADMLEARLKTESIAVLRKYREGGGYLTIYMGMTNYGIDLYVPADQLERARELLVSWEAHLEFSEETVLMDVPEESEEDTSEQWNLLWLMRRRWRGALLLLFFIPGVVWVIVLAVQTMLGR